VRRVAEAHGGTVSVEDAPEGGAIFILTFPHRKK
jgi:signal transduction histidine kinase